MNETSQQDKPAPYMQMSGKQLLQVALLGAVVGLLVWALSLLLAAYVLPATFCSDSQAGQCTTSAGYGEAIATIIAAGFGLFVLVKLHVFRPLLVVVATVISMWGIVAMISPLPRYGAIISCVFLYAFAYMLFTWITRLRLFWIVTLLLLVVIVGIRLILNP